MPEEQEEPDYHEKHGCFGRYGKASTAWNPDNALYLLCQHCARRELCYVETKEARSLDE